jgi:multidrug resistance efflux pump
VKIGDKVTVEDDALESNGRRIEGEVTEVFEAYGKPVIAVAFPDGRERVYSKEEVRRKR